MADEKTGPKVGEFKMLRVGACFPSKTNPRERGNGGDTAELVESVRSRGVLQPIVVRPKAPGYEVVAGHRRLEAAIKAGLLEIPATVLDLTDLEALEIQVIENLQRADLHPLDEAEGFAAILKAGKWTVEDLAARLGKSRGYVYSRLKLCDLPTDAKKAFVKGDLLPGIALLIARIPVAKIREEAWKHLGRNDWTLRDAQAWVRENAMLELSKAPFDPTDKALVATAGCCTLCPKRTGNAAELFPDVQAKDLCTDAVCFNGKADRAWKIKAEKFEADGGHVLTQDETKEVFKFGGGHVDSTAAFVKLDGDCWDDPNHRSYREILGKNCPAVHLARTNERGVVELVKKTDLKAALKEAGLGRLAGGKDKPVDAEEASRKREAKARKAAATSALAEVLEIAAKAKLDAGFLRKILRQMDFGPKDKTLEKATETELKTTMVEAVTQNVLKEAGMAYSDGTTSIGDLCKAWGVDWKAHLAKAEQDAQPKKAAKAQEPGRKGRGLILWTLNKAKTVAKGKGACGRTYIVRDLREVAGRQADGFEWCLSPKAAEGAPRGTIVGASACSSFKHAQEGAEMAEGQAPQKGASK